MRVPYFKAKDSDNDTVWEGFYMSYPQTTFCFSEDYNNHPVKMIHCLTGSRSTDWGLPNEPICATIDPSTLEYIGDIDTDVEFYQGKSMILPPEQSSVDPMSMLFGAMSGVGASDMEEDNE